MKKQIWLIVPILFLLSGCSLSAEDKALIKAADDGDYNSVKGLIEKGANVNARDNSGKTPLYWAATFGGREDVVKLLIDEGADVNTVDRDRVTPLHKAAESGHKHMAELLIQKGAKINAKDKKGKTPLDYARMHYDLAELLESKGAKR